MAKKRVTQIYYDPNSVDPKKVTSEQLITGSIFEKFMPIISLGIQAISSEKDSYTTNFILNGNNNDIIKLGYTGIYELDLTGISQISKLQIIPGENEKILVDIIYESEE